MLLCKVTFAFKEYGFIVHMFPENRTQGLGVAYKTQNSYSFKLAKDYQCFQ